MLETQIGKAGGLEKESVRKLQYAVRMDLNDAVECAIEACIKEGVLVDFLRENRSEVKMLSILEYDEEWEKKKLRKAEYEAGREEGIEAGRAEGIAMVAKTMYAKGMDIETIASMTGMTKDELEQLCRH